MRLPQPRATLWLLGITSAAWFVAAFLGVSDQLGIAAGFIPARLEGMIIPGAVPLWLTPLTATLLHAGIIHLGFNMLMLGYCGRFSEYALGSRGLIILYLIGAYAAAFAQYLSGPFNQVPMVGASGAISAVVGAYALLFSQRKGRAVGHPLGHWLHVAQLAAAWIFVQLLVGFATIGSNMSIAVAAHIGGFIAGLLLARPLLMWRERRLLG